MRRCYIDLWKYLLEIKCKLNKKQLSIYYLSTFQFHSTFGGDLDKISESYTLKESEVSNLMQKGLNFKYGKYSNSG